MLPQILAQIGLPALLDLVGKGLKKLDSETAKQAGEAVSAASETLTRGGVTAEQLTEANRHIEALAQMDAQKEATQISEINQSLRAEVTSGDWYVRRMRPTFGYLMAITWSVQMLALAYAIVFQPEQAVMLIRAMDSLGLIWSVGLSVLGIYVYKRSEDKKRIN